MELTKGKVTVGILCIALAVVIIIANAMTADSPKGLADRYGVPCSQNMGGSISILADEFDTEGFDDFLEAMGVDPDEFDAEVRGAKEQGLPTASFGAGAYRLQIVMDGAGGAPLGVNVYEEG